MGDASILAMDRAKNGDADYFKTIESEDIMKARKGEKEETVLHVAAEYGHLSCCKVIYEICPQLLCKRTIDNVSALHIAARFGREDIIQFLLDSARGNLEEVEKGVQKNEEPDDNKLLMMVDKNKETALHWVVRQGHLLSAARLIKADISNKLVVMEDQDSRTALHLAVKYQHFNIVKVLVSNSVPGFEFPADKFGRTPLLLAYQLTRNRNHNAEEIKSFLIEKQAAQCRKPRGNNDTTLIHIAAGRGDLSTVKEIIQFCSGCCEWLDKDGRNFLHIAASHGQVNVAKYALALDERHITYRTGNTLLNTKDNHGDTPLHLAMSNTDTNVALTLLDDSRVNKLEKNEDGKNPFDVASKKLLESLSKFAIRFASKGDVEFFRLIQVDVFLQSRNKNGESVLSVAVTKGHLNCCEVILERCKELLRETNKNGYSNLHAAASNGQDKILKFLLKFLEDQKSRGESSDLESLLEKVSFDNKESALHLAVKGGHLESVELLITADTENKLLEMINIYEETALHIAVKGQHFEIVKRLVGVQPNFKYSINKAGSTPLLVALQEASLGDRSSVEIRNFLITKQPEQCAMPAGTQKWSLIHHATHMGDLDAIEEITRLYPECFGSVDVKKNNILHLAAKFNQVEVVNNILEHKNMAYDLVNGKDVYGNTPSHVAVSCGNQAIAQVLLNEPRFDRESKNSEGKTANDMGQSVPFQCAKNREVDFFRTIQENVLRESRSENNGDSLLSVAVRDGYLDCCEVIFERCPELLCEKNKSGSSPLHIAVLEAKQEIVKFFINADSTGELLKMADNNKETALHLAVKKRQLAIVNLLLDLDSKKVLLRITDGNGETPLHIAVKKRQLDIVQLLVKANPECMYFADNSSKSPLLISLEEALHYNNPTTVEIRNHLIQRQSSQGAMPTTTKEWTLLHHATSKQDIDAIEQIIQCFPESVYVLDSNGQNFLHLAVRSENEILVNYILRNPRVGEFVLNEQDNNGDTPLHLATAGRNVNISLALLYDKRVRKIIQNKKRKIALETIDFLYDLSRADVEGLTGTVDAKELKSRSDFDLIVGALIATVSFTAGITVPGGFFNDGPNRGNAILYKKTTFKAFVLANTIALTLSLFVVLSHFCLRHLVHLKNISRQLTMAKFSLVGAIFAMLVAFLLGSFAVLSISFKIAIAVIVICSCFFGFSIYSFWVVMWDTNILKRKGRGNQLLIQSQNDQADETNVGVRKSQREPTAPVRLNL